MGDLESRNLTFVSGRLRHWRMRVNSSPGKVIGRGDITTERLAPGNIACLA